MDYDPTKPGKSKQPLTFEKELEDLINKYSQENASNTPDFVLAQYLTSCLQAWNMAVVARETWYGRHGTAPATIAEQEELFKTLVPKKVDETQTGG